MRQHKYEYDAFISHAVEDKIPIANELCAKLERAGLRIWYSGKELGVGDSIEKTIERGLNRSRYGIVIFSPTYLAKNWTIREFYTLLAKEIEEQKVILPVLYNITLDELKNKDLVMADRFAVNSDRGIDFVVDRLVSEIKKSHTAKKKEAWFSRMWVFLILSLLANVALLLKGNLFSSSANEHGPLVRERSESQMRQVNPETLLGEMNGLLAGVRTCGCNHGEHSGASPVYSAGFSEADTDNPPQWAETRYATPEIANIDSDAPTGSKLTMAVVFQIEMPNRPQPRIDQEVDRIFRSISLKDKDDRFVRVADLGRYADHAACDHGEPAN